MIIVHKKTLKVVTFRELVLLSDDEIRLIQYRYKMLVARILLKHFKKFSRIKSYISGDIDLLHENSEASAIKSDITMPVLMKDEKKYSDCVDVLDQFEEWTHKIYKSSGRCKDLEADQPPVSHPVISATTRPDQPRSHVPPVMSESDPLQGIKIPCFGDELTRVRFAGACDLHSGCHTAKQRLDNLYPYRIVGWHTTRSFLKVHVCLN